MTPFMALHREGKMTHRLRIFYPDAGHAGPIVPILKQRLAE